MRTRINDFQVSEHFILREFECPCCHRVMLDSKLIDVLEHIRARLGGRPVIVTSGYRCPEHNELIGGAPNSDHLYGWAADIVIRGIEPEELAKVVRLYLPHGRIGTYSNKSCVHVGVMHRDGLPDRFHI